jgi:hypothetical protein
MVDSLPAENPPLVLFAFNRPHKFRRVLAALQDQGVPRLLILVDGPRSQADWRGVQACQELARGVSWARTDLFFSPQNHGLAGLSQNISRVLESHPAAIFLEDDCLPVPGFYDFMRRALAHYAGERRVFSIGGYQYPPPSFFRGYPYSLVSGVRFSCWGWATWADRWQEARPFIEDPDALFEKLSPLPEIAGLDLPLAVRLVQAGRAVHSWDLPVALAALWLKKVHLSPVEGIVRNIGFDPSGVHRSLTNLLRALFLYNRNVARRAPQEIAWPDDIRPDCNYIAGMRDFVARTQAMSLRRRAEHGRAFLRRYVWPRRLALRDLAPAGDEKPAKRALLSDNVHLSFGSEDDPRFFYHIDVWRSRAILRVLNRMGYAVDVIDDRDRGPLPRHDYDLFIAHAGANFERICRQLSSSSGRSPESAPPPVRKILFTTGSYWRFHNQQQRERLAALEQRRGVRLPLDRCIQPDQDSALQLADGVIAIGDQAVRQTYAGFERLVMINDAALYDDHLDWCPKDFSHSREHFLFYAAPGNVHHGLDLLLEAFSGLKQHLWISTHLDVRFARVYSRELNALENIHLLGWIQPRARPFYQMMHRCAFCILPACSQGQPQTVIEAMNQGLVPLVSPHAGLDVQDFGAILDPVSVESIRSLVQAAATWPLERCGELSARARLAAQTIYSQQAFMDNFQQALDELIS